MTVYCDRCQFIDLYHGILMVRNRKGEVTHLGDAAHKATEASERGEPVILTIDGNPVSRIVNGVEILLEENDNAQT